MAEIDIYGITQGPHQQPDLEDDMFCMIVVAVVDGEMCYDFELYSNDFNWLYGIQKHCLSSMEPFKLEEDE